MILKSFNQFCVYITSGHVRFHILTTADEIYAHRTLRNAKIAFKQT